MKETACMNIILASASPRRRKILSDMGYRFATVPSRIKEESITGETPGDHVARLSSIKAKTVAGEFPNDLVIGADTAVILEGEILGKPLSEKEAVGMLGKLSGRTHTVYTGLALIHIDADIKIAGYDKTEVTFNDLAEERIREYVKSGEPLDKAGSYGIQGIGSFLVKSYSGELDTVIGFPSRLFKKMYEEVSSCLSL
jgi:septum formation protein